MMAEDAAAEKSLEKKQPLPKTRPTKATENVGSKSSASDSSQPTQVNVTIHTDEEEDKSGSEISDFQPGRKKKAGHRVESSSESSQATSWMELGEKRKTQPGRHKD